TSRFHNEGQDSTAPRRPIDGASPGVSHACSEHPGLRGISVREPNRTLRQPGAVECHLLGPLEVVTAAGPLELRGHRRRSLLALLLVLAGTALTLDQIVDAVWGDEDTRGAANTVRTYISQLRKATAGDELVISTVGAGYRLDLPRDRLDATRFEDLARRGAAASDPATRRELFEAALECWGGRALTAFRGLEWADGAARARETRQLEVLEHRIDADLALGRSTELLAELETLVREYPLSERMRGQLMLALYRSG